MSRSLRLAGLCIALLAATACAVNNAPAKPAIGDSCVVGTWTLQHEENKSGYTYASTPVSVAGLQGAKLMLDAGGSETLRFDASEPLVGTLADGRALSITIRGSATFHIHADGGKYTESGSGVQMPTTATLAGAPVTDYHSSYAPGAGTYSCSSKSLTVTTANAVVTVKIGRAHV